MNGQWDFTIGLRETRDLYLLLRSEEHTSELQSQR